MNTKKENLEKERTKVIKEIANCNVKLLELQNTLTMIDQTLWEMKNLPHLFEDVRKVKIVNKGEKNDIMGSN